MSMPKTVKATESTVATLLEHIMKDREKTEKANPTTNVVQEVFNLMEQLHPNVNHKGKDGLTPLSRAILYGYADIVKMLIKNFPTVNPNIINANGTTPYELAVSSKYSKIPDSVRAEIIEAIYAKTDSALIRKFSTETLKIVRNNKKLSNDIWNIIVAANAHYIEEEKEEEPQSPSMSKASRSTTASPKQSDSETVGTTVSDDDDDSNKLTFKS